MKLANYSCYFFAASLLSLLANPAATVAETVKYLRFQMGQTVAYGIVEGDQVRQLSGDLFGKWAKTDTTYPLIDVKLLPPTRPSQVLAMAGNYKSHLNDNNAQSKIITTTTVTIDTQTGEATSNSETVVESAGPGEIPPKFRTPQPFFKSPSCLIGHGEAIVLPPDATTVHYEAELVVVIGKLAKNVSKADALDHVFGVTCGNDVSERVWQKGDVQWWRAKGSDTFGPVGPFIVTGLNYDDLLLTLRLNGAEKQQARTTQLIHDISSTVSFISHHVTLHPGDLIFTGTPGRTSTIKAGDVVEVELEGVGVLRNPVVRASK